MVTHFFYDITHFDSSFFHSVNHLIFKPGYLSSEYMKGRRVKYLHPIRMYVFSSALFFLLLFSVFKPDNVVNTTADLPISPEERALYIERLQKKIDTEGETVELLSKLVKAKDQSQVLKVRDTMRSNGSELVINFTDRPYKTLKEYDSVQKTLPEAERDGWVMRRLSRKQIEINTEYKDKPDELGKDFAKSILHRLPYMLFVSLPLFALILKLVYIRRKQFYYADHGVFTIHLYIFTFLTLMVIFTLDKLDDLIGRDLFSWVWVVLFLGLFFYLYKAMRCFYGQGRGKTFLKFLLVALSSIIMMTVLLLIFIFFSAVTI